MLSHFEEVKDFLFNKLPYFSKKSYSLERFKLQTTIDFLSHINRDKQNFDIVHVAGTNGKGSVSNMLAAILQKHGYKVGLYTSPHLFDFRERIRVDGNLIEEKFVIDFVNIHFEYIQKIQPSFFELMFVLAIEYFVFSNIDIAIIEVGLGGRLDSTNVIKPIVSVITNISFDHTQWLGNTLEQIAKEKAGIIKQNIPVVIGEFRKETYTVFVEYAKQNKAPLISASEKYTVIKQEIKQLNEITLKNQNSNEVFEYKLDLLGNYQAPNLITVLSVLDVLEKKKYLFENSKISDALSHVMQISGFYGRWSVIQKEPLMIIDVAHNEAGLKKIVDYINENNFENVHIIIGMVKDKEAS